MTTHTVHWRATALRALILLIALLLADGLALPATAQDKTLEWKRLDVDIAVQPNGDLRITETNVINFTAGSFTFGYRDVDRARLTSVSEASATDGGQPVIVDTSATDTERFRIKYYLNGAAQNETRTLVISYLVKGATRYYPDGDQVYWAAVYADRNGLRVPNSTVTVRLPPGATGIKGAVYGSAATITGQGESAIKAVATEAIRSGQQMEVRVQFPHGIISGNAPAWQAAFDQRRNYEEVVKPRNDLISLAFGLLTLFGGPSLVLLLRTTRGREAKTGPIGEFLAGPPNTAPGVAGALVLGSANLSSVIATLVDLAQRGMLTMREVNAAIDRSWRFEHGPRYGTPIADTEKQLIDRLGLTQAKRVTLAQSAHPAAEIVALASLADRGVFTMTETSPPPSRTWMFERGPGFGAPLAAYETRLIDALGLVAGDKVDLSRLKQGFYRQMGGLKLGLDQALIDQGMYSKEREATRQRFIAGGILLAVLGVLGGFGWFAVVLVTGGFSPGWPILFFGLLVTGITSIVSGTNMSRRSAAGVEVKARTEAFKRYLQSIERYTDLKAATDLFSRYLPWAIAFGLEKTWVQKFAGVNAPAPSWYVPHEYSDVNPLRSPIDVAGEDTMGNVIPNNASTGDSRGIADAAGGFSNFNQGLTLGIAGVSDGITNMFASVSNTFTSEPVSSSSSGSSDSGWSGGSDSGSSSSDGGGSSGGGGGGFG